MAPKRTKEQDDFEERAAILEFEAGLPREEAERRAQAQVDRDLMLSLVLDTDEDFV